MAALGVVAALSLLWFFRSARHAMQPREKIRTAVGMWCVELTASVAALHWVVEYGAGRTYQDYGPIFALTALSSGLAVYFLIDVANKFYTGSLDA